ncbi:coiled-coil domain-containing protein 107 isoform X2 [Tiliqua scincoides]|uniref:coiled-coil domain-containing protein 107 isoform X2 n=1 Tax=Tiliqua scincoides TaxID=71010 RepID=UPI003461E6E2
MALSAAQRALLSVALGLCLLVAVPRMLGGGRAGGSAPRPAKPPAGRPGGPERILKSHMSSESPESKYQSIQQMRNSMEKELKTERTRGNGRDFALTLMPLYALGVGVFALYKFLKMKSQEESLSKRKNATEDKTKETERQLLELEQHLSQTEKMLNSLLTQLDPLSSCINALASEQKDEIMLQLESIRKLMKESGLDKSAVKPQDISHMCHEKLEDLIQSFSGHPAAEVVEGGVEDCGHGALFEDIEELCGEEGQRHCDHEAFFLDPLEAQHKTEVLDGINQGVSELETGLRRRNRNE